MFDGTGPQGRGPRTGRGLGPCGRGYGRGYGAGLGYGEGYGYGYRQRMLTKKEEAELLQDEAEDLKRELEAIKERIADLEAGK
jgi:hypothetical protein